LTPLLTRTPHEQPLLHYKGVSTARWQKVSDIILIVFGCIAMAYTTALTVKSWVAGEAPKTPGYCDGK